ncbi:hypothetical protein V6N13_105085 [Hibiscus sabdariffa]|uniref:Uncharacterized protein n=1 Tax=Hibiscus sabdariffa TaxID=183260 RepID=A0ABR2SIY9_9ROSI
MTKNPIGIVNNNKNNCEYDQSNVVAANLKHRKSNGSKPPTGRIRKALNGELGFKSFGDGKAIVLDDEMDYCLEPLITEKSLWLMRLEKMGCGTS